MQHQTEVFAEAQRQDIRITRVFNLPVELLYRAFTEAEWIEQWMGTKVLTLKAEPLGSYQFKTALPNGSSFLLHGVFHEIQTNQSIKRTFEMEGAELGVQLEIYQFKLIAERESQLTQHMIFETVDFRDQQLKMPFRQGINWAHNRLEEIVIHK